mgnify:CR=1 FL=1
MISQLIKNDIRYLRLGLIGWGGLLLLPVLGFAGYRTSLGWDPHYWDTLRYGWTLLFIVQLVVQIVLVASLVQKENLKDPRAYWRTRPIPRGQLLLAKLVLVAVLFLLPQLLQVSLAAALFAADAGIVLDALRDGAFLFSIVLIASLIAAGLSRTPGSALLGIIVLPVGLTILDLVGFYRIRGPVQNGLSRLLGDSIAVFDLLFVPMLVCALAGFVLRYFSWRYRKASNWLLGVSLLCLVFGMNMRPERASPAPQATLRLPETAVLTVEPKYFLRKDFKLGGYGSSTDQGSTPDLWNSGGPHSAYGITARLDWSGTPDDWLVRSEAIKTYGPDGAFWGRPDPQQRSRYVSSYHDAFTRALFPDYRHAQRGRRIIRSEQLFLAPQINPDEIEWPVTLTTEFATEVYGARKEPLPLAPGTQIELLGARLLLDGVEKLADRLIISFRAVGVPPIPGYDAGVASGLFVLRDAATGHVIYGTRSNGSGSQFLGFFQTGNFQLEFSKPNSGGGTQPEYELYYIHLDLLGVDVRQVDYVVRAAD